MAEAEQWYGRWLADSEAMSRPPFNALFHLARLLAIRGSSGAAIGVLEQYPWDGLPPFERGYLVRAELYATVGRVEEARTLVAEFEQKVDSALLRRPDVRVRLARASGEMAITEGRFADAVEDFEAVYELSGQCETCGLARLAHAFLQSGQADSALSTYERILSIPTGRGIDDDFARWLPEVHVRLGELYEERRDTANAVVQYSSFIELWENADPELQPRVAAARSRIDELAGTAVGPVRNSTSDRD
jgi:tetratricopeptide (TPR) repeat protein